MNNWSDFIHLFMMLELFFQLKLGHFFYDLTKTKLLNVTEVSSFPLYLYYQRRRFFLPDLHRRFPAEPVETAPGQGTSCWPRDDFLLKTNRQPDMSF